MRAVWLENQLLSFREDVPEPELLKDEALVKEDARRFCVVVSVQGWMPLLWQAWGKDDAATGEQGLPFFRVLGLRPVTDG